MNSPTISFRLTPTEYAALQRMQAAGEKSPATVAKRLVLEGIANNANTEYANIANNANTEYANIANNANTEYANIANSESVIDAIDTNSKCANTAYSASSEYAVNTETANSEYAVSANNANTEYANIANNANIAEDNKYLRDAIVTLGDGLEEVVIIAVNAIEQTRTKNTALAEELNEANETIEQLREQLANCQRAYRSTSNELAASNDELRKIEAAAMRKPKRGRPPKRNAN